MVLLSFIGGLLSRGLGLSDHRMERHYYSEDIKTACSLIEQVFEYVTEMDGIKIFRKPK